MAVIASAGQDLKKPTRAGKESVWSRESARAFLMVSNPHLKFWCGVADFDMNAILRTYCQGGKVARLVGDVEPDAFDAHDRRGHYADSGTEQRRCDAGWQ